MVLVSSVSSRSLVFLYCIISSYWKFISKYTKVFQNRSLNLDLSAMALRRAATRAITPRVARPPEDREWRNIFKQTSLKESEYVTGCNDYATGLDAYGFGFRVPADEKYFSYLQNFQTASKTRPAWYAKVAGGKIIWRTKLTTHIQLMQKLRMHGAIPPYCFVE
jgi:hypothetical protein